MNVGSRFRLLSLLLAVLAAGCSGEPTADPPAEAVQTPEASAPAPSVASAAPADTTPPPLLDDGRTVAAHLADATIAARIRKALVDETSLRAFDFDAQVVDGRVTLAGQVQSAEQRAQAEAVARKVEGVRDVVNTVVAASAPQLATAPPAAPAPAQTSPPPTETPQPASPPPASARPEQPKAEEAASGAVYHTVRSGESLWTISQQHGVTVDQIMRLNNLRSNSVMPRQRLRVK